MNKAFLKRVSLFDRWFGYIGTQSPSNKVLLTISITVFLSTLLFTLYQFNQSMLIKEPSRGGVFTEGMIGAPRFINPVLAITRVDQDIASLLFAGLLKIDTEGNLVPNLAESITVSDDGTVYSVVIKDNLTFSDGAPLTATDVAFTIDLIKNSELKSPLRGSWNDVQVEVVSEKEINFVLNESYSPFIENLTIGILPKHIWNNLTPEEFPFSQNNTEPVGSGEYTVTEVIRGEDGLIQQYKLTAREGLTQTPLIPSIVITFFANESDVVTALIENEIQASGSISNETLRELPTDRFTLYEYPLPRVFGLFINQNKNAVLRDTAVRSALEVVIDREQIVTSALGGLGQPTAIAIPTGFHELQSGAPIINTDEERMKQTRSILENGGWKQNEGGRWEKSIDGVPTTLAFSLSTANNPYFDATATYLRQIWQALGIEVNVSLFEQSDMVQTVIRPRDYEMVLFGNDVGRSLDLFPFWHSSQREDPGLNISLYANISADDTLEAFRATRDKATQDQLLIDSTTRIAAEHPAIFLYNPSFIYVVDSDVSITQSKRINKPSDRFSTIKDWYLTEDSVWSIFAN